MSNHDLVTLEPHDLDTVVGGAGTAGFYEPSQGCVFDRARAQRAVATAARTAKTPASRAALGQLRLVATAPDCD